MSLFKQVLELANAALALDAYAAPSDSEVAINRLKVKASAVLREISLLSEANTADVPAPQSEPQSAPEPYPAVPDTVLAHSVELTEAGDVVARGADGEVVAVGVDLAEPPYDYSQSLVVPLDEDAVSGVDDTANEENS